MVNSFSEILLDDGAGGSAGWWCRRARWRAVERLAQNMFICAPHASQVAALAAFDCAGELEANRAVYATNRALMLEGLPKAGFDRIAPPDGAFYVYADVGHLTGDSVAFAADISRARRRRRHPGRRISTRTGAGGRCGSPTPRRRRRSRKGSRGSRPSWAVEASGEGPAALYSARDPKTGGEQMIRKLVYMGLVALVALSGAVRADDLSALARLDAARLVGARRGRGDGGDAWR